MIQFRLDTAVAFAVFVTSSIANPTSSRTCTGESKIDFSDLSAIPLVPGDRSTVPNPYHNLSYSTGFGVAARGLPTDPNPEQVIFYANTTEVLAAPAITSQSSGSSVISFYPRSFFYLCTVETGQTDVGVLESCTVKVNGITASGTAVSAQCKYTASGVGAAVQPATCNLPTTFQDVVNVNVATVSPSVIDATFVTSFIAFDYLLKQTC